MSAAGAFSILVAATLVLNLPFGYWRASTRKFSPLWFVAVHAPVPLIVALRFTLGVPWSWSGLPVLLPAYFCGQWLGALLRRPRPGPC